MSIIWYDKDMKPLNVSIMLFKAKNDQKWKPHCSTSPTLSWNSLHSFWTAFDTGACYVGYSWNPMPSVRAYSNRSLDAWVAPAPTYRSHQGGFWAKARKTSVVIILRNCTSK